MVSATTIDMVAQATSVAPAELPRLGELPERFTVSVTRLDIAYGIKESGNHCPIACAVRRAFEALGVTIITLDVDDTNCDVLLPQTEQWVAYHHDARTFIRLFDSEERVMPRAVTLWRAA